MKNEPFEVLIGLTQKRIERLKQAVNTLPKKQYALFHEALEGFSTILEELIKLASFPELNPNPIVEIDLNGHIRYRNPAAQRLFPDLQTAGFEHPWLVGLERLFEIVDPKGENTHVREVKVGDSSFAQSIHCVNDGKLLRIYGLDISERKRSEEDLRKREETFRALAENSPDIIERFDEEIRHIYVNPLAAKLHGMPAEALIGKTNQEIGIPEHHWRFWKERIQRVFETGQAIEEENEFPTTGGKRIYQSRLVPERAKDGTVTSVLIVSRDITDRMRAEEMLQEYQKAVESSQDMIAVVDRNYHYLITNSAFLKYRGVGREQVLGEQYRKSWEKTLLRGF
jgi:PAS domain S-box-containing protein